MEQKPPAPPAPGTPARARTTRLPGRPRPRRWLRRLVVFFVLLIVVVLGLAIYLQTSHALTHIYLPIASKQLGTQITADSGSVKFNGAVRLNNLRVMGSDNQPAFEADSVVAKIRPSSLFGEGIPSINLAQLVNAAVVYRDLPEGGNNWSFLPPGSEDAPKSETFPQIEINNVDIKGFRAQYADATGLTMHLRSADLAANNLRPGSTGEFQLALDGQVQRTDPPLDETVNLTIKGTLTQDGAGREIAYNGTALADFVGVGESAALMPALNVSGTFDGRFNNKGAVQQKAQFDARTPEAAVGTFTTDVNWDPESGAREAHLAVTGVSREFLNPIIATMAPLQLAGAAIDVKADVTGSGDRVEFTTQLDAKNLSFHVLGRAEPTPPIAVAFAQNGGFDPAKNVVDWQAMTFAVDNAGNRLIDVALDQPLSLALDGGGGAGLANADAHVKVKITDLTMATLQPWLAIAKVNAATDLKGGRFNGDVVVDVQDQGESVAVTGQVTGAGVAYASFTPLDFTKKINISVAAMDAVKIQQTIVELAAGGQKLADVTVAGDLSLKQQSGSLDVELAVPRVIAAARRVGVLTGEAPAGISDGNFSARQKIMLAGANGPVVLTGNAAMEGVSLAVRGQNVPLGLNVTNNVTLDQKENRLKIDQLRAEVGNPGTAEAGNAEIRGHWPLEARGNAEGEIVATVRKVDLAPWLKLTRAMPEGDIPPIPVEVDEKITRKADGKFEIVGDIRVGVPVPAQNGQEGYQLSLAIRNELTQLGQQIEKLLITLDGAGGPGGNDRVRVEGSGQLGDVTALSLHADVTSLRAEPYLAAMNVISGPAPAQPAPTPAPAPASPPPIKLDSQWSVKEASMGTAKLTDAAGTLNFDQGALEFRMPQGKIAGGAMTAEVNGDLARAQPRFAWKVALAETPVGNLVGAANPGFAEKVSGIVTLQSEGTGEGTAVAALQRSLDARTHFLIRDGELRDMPALDKLAEMTHSDSFRNVKFFKFEGNVNFTPGQPGRIENTALAGPEHKLSFSGVVNLDTTYNIRMDPAVSDKLVGGNERLAMYAALATDSEGYVALPLALTIEGKGAQYALRPATNLPIPGGGGPGAPSLDQTLRGVLGGVVEQKLNERERSQPGRETATTATQTAPLPVNEAGATTPTATPEARPTPRPSREDLLLDAIGGALKKREGR